MSIVTTKMDEKLSVTGQISVVDLAEIAAAGYKSIICNRPDHEEGETQPTSLELEKASHILGINFIYLPIEIGPISLKKIESFNKLLTELPGPILAFCSTGNRTRALYELKKQEKTSENREESVTAAACNWGKSFDIVVIGGGAAGIGVTASLLHRRPALRIAIIESSDKHYYQPAWTLVGGGAFDIAQTVRNMADVIPPKAKWIQTAATGFDPDNNLVNLADGRSIGYRQLIVCPGIRLAWEKIEGLQETLGKNGVTSNYHFDLAPYTWQLTKNLKSGKALFTQPIMPIKCAGGPQKAMYLSSDYWLRHHILDNIEVEFNIADAVLFGIANFVPPLMEYVKRYHAKLAFNSNLVKVDGTNKIAIFDIKDNEGNVTRVEKPFDMLHVVPPQVAPDFISKSPLADAAGFCEVNPKTLQHPRYSNIFSLGDVCSSPNAKTAAAARKQIVIVAENLLAAKEGGELLNIYDGYGACPLTVENGKVILAEFGFGGKLLPTFPLDPTVPSRFAWFLKVHLFPWLYWNGMLKGREWLTRSTGGA
ncbi:bifunctional protein tyrosine phosphatase family protein/NAD(P)/FAD-dependent oxidoreductase [Nitrosomonas sp. Nm166]|uniref:bifunctional protein tyrosine phosphatase family protein/NAD(P)/FAD-dependent oxidoreductase n=1 Tax=Nitrosomonas sp. Nm166 TaxID=1881054 RepID=UPI0008EF42D1|nr:bifunctional protein tyrosine phosphatase family protein/NAD(P)/FAD-dependent oxidoreductase [Nitrosomonas sp. Nm166]SFE56455.1 sulfide:quinone oxidoreductase [Nitrosomonas sp. Nm166]